MPIMQAAFSLMPINRRAPYVAMLTWSSWLAEVGMLSTLLGKALHLFSLTSAAAVTWASIKPELTPGLFTKNAGKPLKCGSTKSAVRRSDKEIGRAHV